jgi:hypothetical protein
MICALADFWFFADEKFRFSLYAGVLDRVKSSMIRFK